MTYLYLLVLLAVVGGHFFFAYGQWFQWPNICKRLTHLTEGEAHKTTGLGRSFASYNASIGTGICFSFLLPEPPRDWTQGVVLAFVVATAAVGASETKGNTILVTRLLPAAIALVLLFLSQMV